MKNSVDAPYAHTRTATTHLSRLRLFLFYLSFIACHQPAKAPAFYYWKTAFALDSLEKTTLKANAVQDLYLRYFDVDWAPEDSAPIPKAPVTIHIPTSGYSIHPVVFLRNRVFEKIAPTAIPGLADNVLRLIGRINNDNHIPAAPLQFDCDWTVKTKDKYFAFLRTVHEQSQQRISATIRLHQVKYPDQTGIPPVDHGILMFYNMGDINAGTSRSIYEKAIAHRYTPALRSYPLALDLALPIFTWGLQIRDGKVVQLLDKASSTSFDKDTSFKRAAPGRYTAIQSGFKNGFYFQQGDQVKIEAVTQDDLLQMVSEFKQHSNHPIGQLLFFDLDSQNLQQYDPHIFKEVLDHSE